MANDSIYLMSGEELVEMRNQPYESEDLLQELLAKHPDLLAGSQMNADVPRRWLLVRRDLGVPGGEGEASRFSLDHLFIDQDAIPTLVEVKRSTDTRLRREVVGQMLDYAANGSKYWPPDSLEAEFKARCAVDGLDADSLLAEHLAGNDADAFWATVGENIRTGRLRLVFPLRRHRSCATWSPVQLRWQISSQTKPPRRRDSPAPADWAGARSVRRGANFHSLQSRLSRDGSARSRAESQRRRLCRVL